MARLQDKIKALRLRQEGKSYSQIKRQLNVSKSTLSLWLADHPLSRERINELRAKNPQRIERFRATMAKKKSARQETIYQSVASSIGKLSQRELFIAGLFLYWGEGSKTMPATIAVTNTDPAVLQFFVVWLKSLGVNIKDCKANLHLYSDMEVDKAIGYWSKILGLPKSCFKKPYIKKSKLSGLTYGNGFGHGTCMLRYGSRELTDRVMMSLRYIRDSFATRL